MVRIAALGLTLAVSACGSGTPSDRLDRKTLEQAAALSEDVLQTELGLSPERATLLGMDSLVPEQSRFQLDNQSQAGYERARLIRIALLTRLNQRSAMPPDHPVSRDLFILTDGLARLTDLQKIGHGRLGPVSARPYAIDPFSGAWVETPYLLLYDHTITSVTDAEAWLDRLTKLAPALDDVRRRLSADAAVGLVPPSLLLEETHRALTSRPGPEAVFDQLLTTYSNLLAGAAEIEPEAADVLLSQAELVVSERLGPSYLDLSETVESLIDDAPQLPGLQGQPLGFSAWSGLLNWYALDPNSLENLHGDHEQSVALRISDLENAQQAYLEQASETVETTIANESVPEDLTVVPVLPSTTVRRATIGPSTLLASWRVPQSIDGRKPQLLVLLDQDMNLWPAEWQSYLVRLQDDPDLSAYSDAIHQAAHRTPARAIFEAPSFALGWPAYVAIVNARDRDGTSKESLQAARMTLLVAVLATIDTGMHTQRWSFETSADYLKAHLDVSDELAQWLCLQIAANPGEASARLFGQSRFTALEARARAILNDRFDQADFQTALLQDGPRPFRLVERDVERWYEGQISR